MCRTSIRQPNYPSVALVLETALQQPCRVRETPIFIFLRLVPSLRTRPKGIWPVGASKFIHMVKVLRLGSRKSIDSWLEVSVLCTTLQLRDIETPSSFDDGYPFTLLRGQEHSRSQEPSIDKGSIKARWRRNIGCIVWLWIPRDVEGNEVTCQRSSCFGYSSACFSVPWTVPSGVSECWLVCVIVANHEKEVQLCKCDGWTGEMSLEGSYDIVILIIFI